MKRIMGLMFCVVMLLVPAAAFAEGDQIGVYVAPKFVYGLTQMHDVRGWAWPDGDPEPTTYQVGNKTDNVFGGSLAVGYDFEKAFDTPLRVELEYSLFSRASAERRFAYGEFIDDEDLTREQTYRIQTLFFNAYWDFDTGTDFTPYIGAGLGMAFIKTEANSRGENPLEGSWNMDFGSKTVTNFAWNLGLGLGYDISDSWTLDVGYRFVGLGSAKTNTYPGDTIHMKTDDLYQHQFSFGVRYTF